MNTKIKALTQRLSGLFRNRFSGKHSNQLTKSAMFGFLLACFALPAHSTELLNEGLRDGALPVGWAQVDTSFQTAAGGYARLDETTATLTTESFDASGFDIVELAFSVAKFGTGDNGPLSIEYSLNGGVDWTPLGDSSTPTSSTYINDVFTINAVSGDMQVRFSRPDSPSQKRLRDLVITGVSLTGPPTVEDVVFSGIQAEEATATAAFTQNAGADFTEYGFAIAEAATNPSPEIGGTGVARIDFDPTIDPLTASIEAVLTGLSAETEYAVRAYVIFDSGAETIYSATATTFTTLAPPEPAPAVDGVTDYTQDFSTYVSAATLPTGWTVTHDGGSDYDGDWGSGSGNGPRGNASVLGFQHTGGTGTAIKTLTILNDTGAVLDAVTVSYDGRVERAEDNEALRFPAYSVFVNGVEVSGLAYSTTEGDSVSKVASISGLAIPAGGSFTIQWESTRGSGSGGAKQIGISNVAVSVGAVALPPVVELVTVDSSSIFQTEFFASSSVLADNGDSVTSRGFVLAETATNPSPEIGGSGVTEIPLGSGLGSFDTFVSSLTPGTEYSIRAFATNSVGTAYSAPLVVETLSNFPLLGATAYTQTFSGYDGSLPPGWQAVSSEGVTVYLGDWGSGTSGGFRGNEITPGVLGYQHAGGTGELIVSLTLINDTGSTIENLEIGYLGRVERADQGRSPSWTVEVDFTTIEGLSYSTVNGVDEAKSALLTGLFIPQGGTFTISWTSDNIGVGIGSSRQIGISDVSVEAIEGTFLSPVDISPASDTYLEPVTVSMFSFDSGVEIRYTLDGTTPTESSLLYTGDFVLNEPTEVQAIAFPTDPLSTAAPSSPTIRNYNLPIVVTELADVSDPILNQLYRFDTEVIVSYIDGGPFRNQAYVTDATGGVFVDDPGANLDAPNNHSVGDGITGLVGTFSVFQGQLQFTPDPSSGVSTGLLTSTDNAIPTVTATLDELFTNFTEYRYRLVSVSGITFDAGDGVTTFGSGGSLLDMTDASGVGEFYVFFSTDYIGTVVPSGSVDLLGIPHSRANGNFISARSLSDFDTGSTPPTAPLDDYLTQRSLSLSDLETDTNGNGFTVIEEYFAGFGDGAGGDTIVYGIDPAGPALTLTSDLASDPDGVVVALFATSDLTTAFAPVAFTVSSVDNGDGTFTRSYTETTPPTEADNRFYRLSITVEVD